MTDSAISFISLLRALARGSTIEELAEASGLSTRTVQRRLLSIEEAGIEIARPQGRGQRKAGLYRLADPRQVTEGPEASRPQPTTRLRHSPPRRRS